MPTQTDASASSPPGKGKGQRPRESYRGKSRVARGSRVPGAETPCHTNRLRTHGVVGHRIQENDHLKGDPHFVALLGSLAPPAHGEVAVRRETLAVRVKMPSQNWPSALPCAAAAPNQWAACPASRSGTPLPW